MAIDIAPFVDPQTTAIIALEVQENLLIPEKSMIPGLARHASESGLVKRLETLYSVARDAGAKVYYVTDERRADGYGAPTNLMVQLQASADREHHYSHGPIVSELMPKPEDVWLKREQGMTGFFSTPLDSYLRNAGIKTVILTGVSANIAVNGTAIEAMNLGYRVIVIADGIAGDPPEYVDALLKYTIRNVAIVVKAEQVMSAWQAR